MSVLERLLVKEKKSERYIEWREKKGKNNNNFTFFIEIYLYNIFTTFKIFK